MDRITPKDEALDKASELFAAKYAPRFRARFPEPEIAEAMKHIILLFARCFNFEREKGRDPRDVLLGINEASMDILNIHAQLDHYFDKPTPKKEKD
jgi:hypothetical protein